MGQTVAVVSAWDDPDAATDLAAYRTQYGIPACTTASGCFTKTDENGGTSYPAQSPGWSATDALSMDIISAVCPNCHILLVEASSTAMTDLGTAENTAATLGAKFIDNDWYTAESAADVGTTGYDTEYFDHPGVAITAPSGNSGYGTINYPAASQYVTSVGGTTLTAASTTVRGWTETAWSGTGSGCSEYDPKPSWQTDTGCSGRTLNDLAAVADPNTPVAFYDTPTEGGWGSGGGTAVASALVAAAYALAGTPASGTYPSSYPYAQTNLINDITSGSTGTCSPSYLCTAGTGYDGPTGLGTPASAAALGALAPAASLPGAAMTYNPLSGNLEAYATKSGNTLEEDYWDPTGGNWSGWKSLGGSITGRPTAIYDPRSGNLDVYARGTGNTLEETYWQPGGNGWSAWKNLGGSITGSPAAIYNPGSGNLEVYATGTGGTLERIYWNPSGGWSNWANLGGSITGTPAVAYNPGSGNLEVYAAGTGNTLEEIYWQPGGSGWSAWKSLAGSITGGPDAVYNPASGNMEVYAAGTGGTLERIYWHSGSGWSSWDNLGGSITASPSAVYNPASGNLEVYARGTGNTLEEIYLKPGGGGWSAWKSLAGTLSGGPVALYNPGSGNLEVYAPDSSSVEQISWNSSNGWSAWKDLDGDIVDL